jgi:hypothetical protein
MFTVGEENTAARMKTKRDGEAHKEKLNESFRLNMANACFFNELIRKFADCMGQ